MKPALTLAAIEAELRRRGCAFVIISPDMIREQWEVNCEADGTKEKPPTEKELAAVMPWLHRGIEKAVIENELPFEWGATSDACEAIRDMRKARKGGRP